MKVFSDKAGCFALSVLSIALSQAVYAAEEPTQLPEVTVTASPIGNTQGYAVPVVRTATKTDTPVLETPMAVQVIPKDVLEDKQIVSIQEAVKNVSGVQTPTSVYYDVFALRGFQTGSDTFRNGLKLSGVIGTEDMSFVDHVEIAKGPTAMLYGRVQPGGLVNVVTKTPQPKSAFGVQQQIGGWNTLRTTADATGAANDDKTVLYRVMGAYDKGDSFIDYQKHDNMALAAYFSWLKSSQFQANAQLEYYDQKGTSPAYSAQQIPIIGNRPANMPRNWTQNDPVMWSLWPNTVKRTTAAFDWSYAFNEDWKVTHRFNYYTADEVQTYLLYQAFNAATNMLSRRISNNPVTRNEVSTNLDLTGEFKTGETKHKVLLGLDWFGYETVFYGYNESGSTLNRVPTLNIFAPIYGNINVQTMQAYFNAASSNILQRGSQRDAGIYAQDQISLGKNWEVLLGGRYDIARNVSSSLYATVSQACYPNCTGYPWNPNAPTDRQFSPKAGLLYKLSGEVSLYGSYSKSFGSNNLTSASFSGTQFDPQIGVQYEVGAKASLLDGKVTTSATVFDLRLQNVLTPDLAHPGFSIAAGEVQSLGFEYDVAGQVTDHVSLIGSYTYDEAKITKDNTAGAGNTVGKYWAGVPLNNVSLWSKYDTAPGSAEGFTYGAGVYLNGQRQLNNTNTAQLPGYGRVDMMIGYRTKVRNKKMTAQLNVQNLTDKTYFEYGSGSYAQYGAPRNLMASLKLDL